MKKILFILLIVVMAFLLIFFKTSLFHVNSVSVEGDKSLDDNEIIALSGITGNENIFLLNISQIENNILSDPKIDSVTIKRDYIRRNVTIQYQTKMPLVILPFDNSYVLLDEKGYVIEVSDTFLPSVVMVTHLDINNVTVGQMVEVTDNDKLYAALACAKAAEKSSLLPFLSEINVKNAESIVLFTTEGIKVLLGNLDDIDYKMDYIYAIMLDRKQKGIGGGTLDIRYSISPIYVPEGVAIDIAEDEEPEAESGETQENEEGNASSEEEVNLPEGTEENAPEGNKDTNKKDEGKKKDTKDTEEKETETEKDSSKGSEDGMGEMPSD